MNLLLKICLRPSPRANVFYALVEAYQDAWAEQSESGTTSWASQRYRVQRLAPGCCAARVI